jgi:hypothetical protein
LKRLDKFFGGRPGDAERMLDSMKQTYGPKDGQTVFDATVLKRKRRKTTARHPPKRSPPR